MEYELIKELYFMGKPAVPSGFKLKQEDDGRFYLVYNNVQLTYDESELKDNTEYFKLVVPVPEPTKEEPLPDSVEELIDPDITIKQWRIQLDVTTDKETLLKIDRAVKDKVKEILKEKEIPEGV